jgi:hypothetical protein
MLVERFRRLGVRADQRREHAKTRRG